MGVQFAHFEKKCPTHFRSPAVFERGSPVPCMRSRNPPRHVSAIFIIIRAKHFAERRLLIEFHKQNNGNRGNKHHQKCNAVRSAEHNPQAHPAREEAHIHRVSHVPVKSDHHQPLWRNKRRRCPTARPSEIPDTSQRHGKTEHRGHHSNPSPPRPTNGRNIKPQPGRQQLEP